MTAGRPRKSCLPRGAQVLLVHLRSLAALRRRLPGPELAARRLHVHRATAYRAYARLRRDGYLDGMVLTTRGLGPVLSASIFLPASCRNFGPQPSATLPGPLPSGIGGIRMGPQKPGGRQNAAFAEIPRIAEDPEPGRSPAPTGTRPETAPAAASSPVTRCARELRGHEDLIARDPLALADRLAGTGRYDLRRALGLVLQARDRRNPAAWLSHVLGRGEWGPADWALEESGRRIHLRRETEANAARQAASERLPALAAAILATPGDLLRSTGAARNPGLACADAMVRIRRAQLGLPPLPAEHRSDNLQDRIPDNVAHREARSSPDRLPDRKADQAVEDRGQSLEDQAEAIAIRVVTKLRLAELSRRLGGSPSPAPVQRRESKPGPSDADRARLDALVARRRRELGVAP